MNNLIKIAEMLISKGEVSQNILGQIDAKLSRQLSSVISKLRKKGLTIHTTQGRYAYTEDVVYILEEKPTDELVFDKLLETGKKSAQAIFKRKFNTSYQRVANIQQ